MIYSIYLFSYDSRLSTIRYVVYILLCTNSLHIHSLYCTNNCFYNILCIKDVWRNLITVPMNNGFHYSYLQILGLSTYLMLRRTRSIVEAELQLKPQAEVFRKLTFSAIEVHIIVLMYELGSNPIFTIHRCIIIRTKKKSCLH